MAALLAGLVVDGQGTGNGWDIMVQEDRKHFKPWQVDRKFIEQDGVCATPGCHNPLFMGFHRHHKNGDNSDNSYGNLQLLCIECHFTTLKGKENPLEQHRELQRKAISGILKAIGLAMPPGKLSGSTLERILSGYAQAISESWKEKGLRSTVEYPSPFFSMIRDMQKSGVIQDAIQEGVKMGIKAALSTISNVVHGELEE